MVKWYVQVTGREHEKPKRSPKRNETGNRGASIGKERSAETAEIPAAESRNHASTGKRGMEGSRPFAVGKRICRPVRHEPPDGAADAGGARAGRVAVPPAGKRHLRRAPKDGGRSVPPHGRDAHDVHFGLHFSPHRARRRIRAAREGVCAASVQHGKPEKRRTGQPGETSGAAAGRPHRGTDEKRGRKPES